MVDPTEAGHEVNASVVSGIERVAGTELVGDATGAVTEDHVGRELDSERDGRLVVRVHCFTIA